MMALHIRRLVRQSVHVRNNRAELREGRLTANQSEREERLSRKRECDRVRRQTKRDKLGFYGAKKQK